MSKHTPGKWEVGVSAKGAYQIHVVKPSPDHDDERIVLIEQIAPLCHFSDINDKHRHNAALISAAPDLLEALILVVKAYPGQLLEDQMGEDAAIVNAAIAKATTVNF